MIGIGNSLPLESQLRAALEALIISFLLITTVKTCHLGYGGGHHRGRS